MAGRKKTREAATLGPMLDGYQSVDGNDSGAERNEGNTESLRPLPPRKSARIAATAKSNDGPS